jgi:hypothetical protein
VGPQLTADHQSAQQHLKDISAIHPTVLLSNFLLLSAA